MWLNEMVGLPLSNGGGGGLEYCNKIKKLFLIIYNLK